MENSLFGIVQGGMYQDLRHRSAEALSEMAFSGYALGGLSVGEPKAVMYEMADITLPLLPERKPKYIMGVGTPEDLVTLVAMGADMFDCVMPTRNARNGQIFTENGKLNISNARFREDTEPLDSTCGCYTCRTFSAAYLQHLFKSGELLAYRLATIHNLYFLHGLMEKIRTTIADGTFSRWREEFWSRYEPTDEEVRVSQKQKWLKSKRRGLDSGNPGN